MPEVAKKFAEDDPEKDRDLPKYKYGKTTSPEVKKKYDKKKKEEEKDLKKAMSCPVAAKNVKVNTKNRNLAIKSPEIKYGPLNVDNPGDYWEKLADHWDTSESAAKKSLCGNCVAFDISPRMDDCMPGDVSEGGGRLGYCWMHHFKCHSERTCYTWAKGGPISKDKVSHNWQKKADMKKSFVSATALLKKAVDPARQRFADLGLKDQPGKKLRTPGMAPRKDFPGFKASRKVGNYYQGTFDPDVDQKEIKSPTSKPKAVVDSKPKASVKPKARRKVRRRRKFRRLSKKPLSKQAPKQVPRLSDGPEKMKFFERFYGKTTKPTKIVPVKKRGGDLPVEKPKTTPRRSVPYDIDRFSGMVGRRLGKSLVSASGLLEKGMGGKMKSKAKDEMIVLVSAVDGKGMKKAELEKKRVGGTEAKVLQVLKVEGGAAGMKTLKEKINAPDLKDAVDSLMKRGEIFKHEDGDIIKREKKGAMEKQMSSAKMPMMSTPTPTRAGGMGYSGGQMMGKSLNSIPSQFSQNNQIVVTEAPSRKIGGPRPK